MYRQGLGDCILVTFDPTGAKPVHLMIDCGTLGAKTVPFVSISDAVKDIKTETKNHLDLLVVTHEHKDHVSGFGSETAAFQEMTIDRVWMAWTENPADPLAREIAKFKGDLGVGLASAAEALRKAGMAGVGAVAQDAASLGDTLHDLLGFAGDVQALGAGKFASTVNEAMNFARTGLGSEARYLNPGGPVIEESWAPGFRFYVLGPPRSAAAIKDTGNDDEGDNFYHLAPGFGVAIDQLRGVMAPDDPRSEEEMPFDPRFRMQADDALLQESLREYLSSALDWRRVDFAWLGATADLALQLDSATNNTSLALAIERISDGRVLLFPADSQRGPWLSWHDPQMKWWVQGPDGTTQKTATNLLNETVFYKAGHHASHNGTASQKGLELMQRDEELVAFIPVDRAIALTRNPKGSWKMPARPLYRRLLEKCQGRVVRTDLGWAADASTAQNQEVEKEFLDLAKPAEWAEWAKAQKAANVTITDKYVEYVLK